MKGSVQFGAHALKVRKDDLYETPPAAVRALLRHYDPPGLIWEPACGPGAIVRTLQEAGHAVVATDLVDYGLPGAHSGRDFLMELNAPPGVSCIITNPPFKLAEQFARHALTLVDEVWLLQRLAWIEGAGRSDFMDHHLYRLLVGKERLPMMHRDGWDGPKLSASAMPFAWFGFRRQRHLPTTLLERISWRDA